jgi:predicted enzyme related to lactoylglutathione lyase
MTASTPGAPNWVDLGTADLEDAKRFYTRLFGWTADVSGDEYGGYTTFLLNGLPVAGAGPLYGEGQPTAWSTYLATDDADAVAARVEAAGGKVLVAPFDVMDQGRMAAFLDQAGAPFSVWQPGAMPGAELFDVPGSLTWNELNTRDVEGSKAFYGSVFGWLFRDSSMAGLPYVVGELNGAAICGMQPMIGESWPDDMSPPVGGVRARPGRSRPAAADHPADRPLRRPGRPRGRHLLRPRHRHLGRCPRPAGTGGKLPRPC